MSPCFTLKQMKNLKGYTIEWADGDGYIISMRNQLYVTKDLNQPFELLGEFPSANFKQIITKSRVVQRVLRFLYYNVIKLTSDRIFVTFQKNIGLFENGKFTPIVGLARPARFLRGGCAVDKQGGVYLGEYFSNPERQAVNVYYLPPNSQTLKVVYSFEPKEIRHIHGLYFDPYEEYLWVLTGDFPEECNILRTKDQFKTIEVVGRGDETWRTVSIAFRKDAIYYATDAEYQQNHVYKLDRATLKRTALFAVDGPVYYTKSTDDHLFFGVTAEGCKSQVKNFAYLWAVDHLDRPQLVAEYKKDFLPISFMPGTLHFPLGELTKNLYVHCLGLNGVDNQMLELTYK